MNVNQIIIRPLVAVLAFALCGAPEALAQTQQAPSTATTPQTGASQDATQQPMTAPATQQQSWPTQDSATPNTTPAPSTSPDANAPSATAPSTTAPNSTAPNAAQQAPSTTQPAAPAERQRVVLGPNGQTQAPTSQQNRGTTVDPSAAPIAPAPNAQPSVPTETPEDQTQPPTAPQPQPEVKKPPVVQQQPAPEPLGTAAAESVKTSGNGASKPAGAAIAPAKQNRKRSLLIKLGAIAAVGVAVGTVAALSRATPGNPPNTSTSASTAGR